MIRFILAFQLNFWVRCWPRGAGRNLPVLHNLFNQRPVAPSTLQK